MRLKFYGLHLKMPISRIVALYQEVDVVRTLKPEILEKSLFIDVEFGFILKAS